MALLCMAIHDMGVHATSFTGSQAGIVTDSTHGKAKIIEVRADRLRDGLALGHVVVVAGFQGVSLDKEVTTMGRGASDLTAVALASALGADACEIYTDVNGVYTADPRVVPNARRLASVSYEEMLEMAATGGKVLALRSVEFARNHGVALHVRSSFTWEPGTWVRKEEDVEKAIISGVTHDLSEAKVTVVGVPDKPGIAARLFRALADEAVNVDMIEQNVSIHGVTDISFTLPKADLTAARRVTEAMAAEIGATEVFADSDIGRISLVGAGMKTHPGVAATMFEALADEGVNIEMISTSSIRISCVVRGQRRRTGGAGPPRPLRARESSQFVGGRRPVALVAMNVGVVGATGLVGGVMRTLLAERGVPDRPPAPVRQRPLGRPVAAVGAAARSSSRRRARPTTAASTSSCSRPGPPCPGPWPPGWRPTGAIVVDNSSAWRSDPDVPLVVAEVNPHALAHIPKGIVANPNCTTMVAMPVLKPLHVEAGLRRVVASTYQAVSGAGVKGVAELEKQAANVGGRADRAGPVRIGRASSSPRRRRSSPPSPSTSSPSPAGSSTTGLTKWATARPTRSRSSATRAARSSRSPDLAVSCTCVRVPGLHRPLALAEPRVRAPAVAGAGPRDPGVGARRSSWPTSPRHSPQPAPTPPTWAGSAVTQGPSNGLALFLSGDNLRKGAALNAVQIAEALARS